jgi:phosphoribosyl-AMP cyclohydrolase / phosphoribosyl-ATP pyrophosphohydrolase
VRQTPGARRAARPFCGSLVYNAGVDDLKWDAQGLIAAVAQDRLTGQVRMLAWMNREALQATLDSGEATFFSRSRGKLWRKGETSGHVLRVHEVVADCDGDSLLLLVDPEGPSCHTGRATCFFRRIGKTIEGSPTRESPPQELADERDAGPFLLSLEEEIRQRASSTAAKSYTRHLLDGGPARIAGKVTEEAGELSQALQSESDERVISEAADVLYHTLVGLRARGLDWRRVIEALAARAGQSGHAEKASRAKT